MKNIKYSAFLILPICFVLFQNCGQLSFDSPTAYEFSSCSQVQTFPRMSLKLISNEEYWQSIQDLTHLTPNTSLQSRLPASTKNYGFDTNQSFPIDKQTLATRIELAEEISLKALNTMDWSTCANTMTNGTWDNCGKNILLPLARKAYRRPLSNEEINDFKIIFETSTHQIGNIIGNVRGHFDVASSNRVISGWAQDPEWPERPVNIHIYVDGPAGQGTFVGNTWTGFTRQDVIDAFSLPGHHGWSLQLPASLADQRNHSIYAYAIGSTLNPLLGTKILNTSNQNTENIKRHPNLTLFQGARMVLTKVFSSPHFLYNTTSEYEDVNFKYAARLASLIMKSVPDDELMLKAERGELITSEQVLVEVERLLAKDSSRFLKSFVGQWQGFRDIKATSDNQSLVNSYKEEGYLVAKKIFDDNLPLSSVLNPGFTFVNPELARIYNLPEIMGWNLVSSQDRGGALQQASFLYSTSAAIPSSEIIRRGRTVLSQFLCEPVPPPSPEIFQEIEEAKEKADQTLPIEDQLAAHRNTNTSCYGCHQMMDPIGLGLQNYDKNGKWRTHFDSGHTINSNGNLLGQKFSGPSGLSKLISVNDKFAGCVEKQLLAYASIDSTSCQIQGVTKTSNGFKDLITEVLTRAIVWEQ